MIASPLSLLDVAGDPPRTYNLNQLRYRFGHCYSAERMALFLDLLQRDQGFPPPYPFHIRKNGIDRLISTASPKSTWPADAVDAWFAEFVPTAADEKLDRTKAREAAADMDAAAGALTLKPRKAA